MSEHWTQNTAPVEASIRFSFSGFETSITLRADSGNELMPTLAKTIEYLKAQGAEPLPIAQPAAAPTGAAAPGPRSKICPIHSAEMRRREKSGDVWYSHKVIDPATGAESYCRGGE